MRRTRAAVTAVLILPGLTLIASPGASGAEEPLAEERYNGFVLTGGQANSSGDLALGGELTNRGAFRIWAKSSSSGYVRSTDALTRKALQSYEWPTAPVKLLSSDTVATDGSGSGDHVAVASGIAYDEGDTVVQVQTVTAGRTTASAVHRVTTPAYGPAEPHRVVLDVAMEGEAISLLVSSASTASEAQALWFLRSTDRGTTWSRPLDLQGLTGLPDVPGIPTVRLAAEADRLAAVVSEGGEQVVLRSTDGGVSWSDLGDPAPSAAGDGARSPLGLDWFGGELRAAWVSRAIAEADPVLMSATAAENASTWSAPESLPSAELAGDSALGVAPLVARLGSSIAVQAAGGFLRTHWDSAWLRPNQIGLRTLPAAVHADHLLYEKSAYVPDVNPPRVYPTWPFYPEQGPLTATGFSVDDEGYLRSVQCWVDGVLDERTKVSYTHCSASDGNTEQQEGSHILRLLATDWAGRTTDQTFTWLVDATGPVVSWTKRPHAWTLGSNASWSWSAHDELTGIARRQSWRQAGVPWHDTTLRWTHTATSAGVTLRPGVTACVLPQAADTVGNYGTAPLSCVTSPTDDAELSTPQGPYRRLRADRYWRHTATELLRPGSRLAVRVDAQRRTRGLALRIRTCPSCGIARVIAGRQAFRVDLHARRSALRTVKLPFTGAPLGIRIAVEKVRGGQVLLDGLFVRTTDS